jgi:hypothetical protein
VTDTATSGASEPTGTVSFTSTNLAGTFSEASCTLAGNGDGTSSSCTPGSYSQSETGTPELTASFAGGGGVAASEGEATLTFTERTTAVSINCEPEKRAVGLSTTCTAHVSDASEGTPIVPTGSVSFSSSDIEGSFTPSSSCTLVSEENGTGADCAVEYSQPDLGEPTIEASYAGDASHTGETATTKVDFTERATSTTVECEPGSLSVDNGASTCKATVTDVETGGVPNEPTGTVEFTSENTNGTFSATSCTLVANGDGDSSGCSVEYSQTEVGGTTITGAYSGDANESPSSGAGSVSFEKRSTTTELKCSPEEPKLDTPTTCTTTVTDTSSGTPSAPTGAISFVLNGAGKFSSNGCTLIAESASSSSCTVEYTPEYPGENPIIYATYKPAANDDHETSEGSFEVHEGYAPAHETSTAVVCSPASLAAGTATSCTATVTDTSATGPYAATGTVSFEASGSGEFRPASSCALDPSGAATSSCKVSYTPGAEGPQQITGSYLGSVASEPSSGETSISASGPHSTSTTVGCTPAALLVGAQSTCTVIVTDTGANPVSPSGTVEFSSSDGGAIAPAGCTLVAKEGTTATCSVTYTPKAAGSDTVTATLVASTADSKSSGSTVLSVSAPPPAPLPEVKPAPQPEPVASEPSNLFTIGKVTLHKKQGTATVKVKLPDAGKLVLSGTGVKRVSGSAKGKATVKVKLKLTGKALKRLKSKHRDKVKFTVQFTPTSGTARTVHKTVTLVLTGKTTKKKGK